MHYNKLFNNKIKINQVVFNKKLNWFFDIKYCIFDEEKKNEVLLKSKELIENFKVLNTVKKKRKIIVVKSKKTKFTNKIYKSRPVKKKFKEIEKIIHNENLQKYIKHFVMQGSYASGDYIDKWSDIDIFAVIKNETFKNPENLIIIRDILKKIYMKFIDISPFQHHGILVYTEKDLGNYLRGFLPPEALEKNINFFRNEKIYFKSNIDKKSLSKKIILERLKYIKLGIKNNYFSHHVFNNSCLKIPLKKDDKNLKQLFCQIGFILNLPILYFDSLGKSVHKKKSFKMFYKLINNKDISNFIKKHEFLRANWDKFFDGKKMVVNEKIVNFLSVYYFNDCERILKMLAKRLAS